MMTAEQQIREGFARYKQPLSRHDKFLGQYSANSRFGFPLSWHDTQEAAEAATIAYYMERMNFML